MKNGVLAMILALVLFVMPLTANATGTNTARLPVEKSASGSAKFFPVVPDAPPILDLSMSWFVETHKLPKLGRETLSEGELGQGKHSTTANGAVKVGNFSIFAPDPNEHKSTIAMIKSHVVSIDAYDSPNPQRIVRKNAKYTKKFGHPSYLVTWNGGKKNQRKYLALTVLTDEYMLIYEFTVRANAFNRYSKEFYKVLDGLEIR